MSDVPEIPEDEGGSPVHPVMEHAGPTIDISSEMTSSFLDYAMSVIVSRAIPDLRDGLKPVHRRILYAMDERGYVHDKQYRKSAKPVGDVMGSYHPHGDSAIYDALVRMAQDFSMSLPLIDGQGNFGSMDGDSPAAMRYTESRLAKSARALLDDIDKDTVDFQDNYDGKEREPVVLPARYPNLLVNGSEGIAVGMATRIPPHNLGEVVDATLALIDDPDLDDLQLMEHVRAPDFPTGGLILGQSGVRKAYTEGRGSVIVRARTHVEEIRKDRFAIVVDEIPYQVNKAGMVERIAEAARDKRIEGISGVADESDRVGVRVVVELKRDATPEVVLNQLFRFTPMQISFACNMLALDGGRPRTLALRDFLTAFLAFREEVIARRTAYELRRARERSHILCGLAVAVSNVDEVVQTIRSSADAAEARERLMTRDWPAEEILPFLRLIDDPLHPVNEDGTYNLSETQARAILELRLQRLTQLGVSEVTDELEQLAERIADYLAILASRARIMEIVASEMRAVRDAFAVPRRTEIVEWSGDMEDEDLIEREDMAVTITSTGYAKRTALSEFRAQRRGGKGLGSMSTKDDDIVTRLFVANTHTPLLIFTTGGIVYKLKTWQLPLGSRTAKGRPLNNIIQGMDPGTGVAAILPIDRDEDDWGDLQIVFATSAGDVRRNRLSDFTNVMRNGKIAMKLPDGVTLVNARIASQDDDVMLVTRMGRAIRFPSTAVRVFASRDSTGVRGIRLAPGDEVVSMSVIRHFEATPGERVAFLKRRRAMEGVTEEEASAEVEEEDTAEEAALSTERYAEMSAEEELILTITSGGSGKLSSSHDYPVRGRGGMGVMAIDKSMRGGPLVASFPVERDDQIMLATSTGQSIRTPIEGVSFRSRSAGGVRIFQTRAGEEVVAVALIADQGEDVATDAEAVAPSGNAS
ncbi:DNA gyrase subunit A [Hasllibacter halocynthiae]|uniref:DNA gyrase subunit A n=1 Tax=Hasllibacter halocynthiae TaxID=595589 RepID=A0A2T0X834_9RHOB|nr:DNA gyrase subunit A [Hasllibacter halocynthiae]PRY95112.1 DNA gyrase subunit A [Hasllibacter halocynthiae]